MKGLDCDKLNYFGDLPMFYKFQGLKCLPIRLSVGKKNVLLTMPNGLGH